MTTRSRALKDYEEKRDFRRTTEPRGRRARRTKPTLAFVVQKHDARRLHYDFRVEWNGVLLSWAVTKGPSLDPADKRLAVRTEDHPLDYASFEGVIPKGEYGGGTVMIWDEGTWEPEGDPEEGLRKGHLKFDLAGERMRGRWDLVRMKPRKGEKRDRFEALSCQHRNPDQGKQPQRDGAEDDVDHHVCRRGEPDLAAQQYPNVEFEADREQQERDTEIRNQIELGQFLEVQGVDDEPCRQKSDQRRQTHGHGEATEAESDDEIYGNY